MATIETMVDVARPPMRAGRVAFTLDDPLVTHLRSLPVGAVTILLGDDPNGAALQIQWVEPNLDVPPHYHTTDYVTMVLQGSLCVGRTWCHPGHFRVQNKESVYGPVKAGPEGSLTVSFYGDRTGLQDSYASERDVARAKARVPFILERLAEAGIVFPEMDLDALIVVKPIKRARR